MERVIGFDLETMPITEHIKSPKIICGGVTVPPDLARDEGLGEEWGTHIRDDIYFFWASETSRLLDMFEYSDLPIVAHYLSFDLGCLSAHDYSFIARIFKLFRARRFDCTFIRSMMAHNSAGFLNASRNSKIQLAEKKVGSFSLAGSLYTFCDKLDISHYKNEEIQTTYSNMEGIPFEKWPDEYREYLIGDVEHLPTLYTRQKDRSQVFVPQKGEMVDIFKPSRRRSCFHYCLNLASIWGVRVDLDAVSDLRNSIETELEAASSALVDAGYAERLKGKPYEKAANAGKLTIKVSRKKIQQEVERSYKPSELKKTKLSQNVQTTKEVLLGCKDPVLRQWGQMGSERTILSTFIPALERGVLSPTSSYGLLHTNFFPYSETGRISAGNPNLLNLSRRGGVRECIVARPGCALLSADYEGNELRSYAQVLLDTLGKSELARYYQEDENFDPHTYMASRRLKIEYQEGLRRKKLGKEDPEFGELRQIMKCCNFGFPAGMASRTFVEFCIGYNVFISLEDAEDLKRFFFAQFPEMRQYLSMIGRWIDMGIEGGVGYVRRNGIVSGGRGYCQLANFAFQSLAADGGLTALSVVTERAYTDEESSLYGTRPLLFVHDEIIIETPLGKAHEAAMELKSVMERCMRLFTPDIPSVVEPTLSLRWTKEAYERYNDKGELIPYDLEI